MAAAKDPTAAIRDMAAGLPEVVASSSCTQSSFKTKKGAFLYIGPGAKGVGFKAMFKLDKSHGQAAKLAAEQPDRFGLGTGQWVVARFTAAKPLPKTLWRKWLEESYRLMTGAGGPARKATKKKAPKEPPRSS